MKCTEIELLLSARLEGEATASQWRLAEAHMQTCPHCAQLWQDFQAGTELFRARLLRFEPSPGLWENIAARLDHAPAIKLHAGERWRQRVESLLPPTPRAAGLMKFGFAMLVLILAGLPFVFHQPPQEMVTTHTPAGRDSTLAAATLPRTPVPPAGQTQPSAVYLEKQLAAYLEDTRVILLEVKNSAEEEQALDLRGLRQTSQRLLEQAVTLKADLKQERAAALQNLVEQLELVLLDLANLADDPQREDVEMLRAAIRQNDLLIKIEIVDLKALAKGRNVSPPKRRPEHKTII